MPHALPLKPSLRRSGLILAGVVSACALGAVVWAQVGGDRGIAAVAASSDIEVRGIKVDETADTGTEAREKAWKEAAQLAWAKINGPKLSDSQVSSMVSAIVIENERLGPRRYIATLGVVFDRARAGSYLGGPGEATHSAPMLLVPVTVSAGTEMVYEQRNPWQQAWAEFQSGASRVDYVRPTGAGGDSLLITYGQTGRRSRIWWRNVLDQYGASDVLIPIARLRYAYPGGPIEGTFTARYGPDDEELGRFTLRADGPDKLPDMLSQAVGRFDTIFQQALAEGKLKPDPTLNLGTPELDPAIQRLVELGRALMAQDRAAAAARAAPTETATDESGNAITAAPIKTPPPEGSVALYTVQVATPDAGAFDGAISAVRGTPGVRATGVRSTAIGGTSVMTVSYAGSIGQLAEALKSRGFKVTQGATALSISR